MVLTGSFLWDIVVLLIVIIIIVVLLKFLFAVIAIGPAYIYTQEHDQLSLLLYYHGSKTI